MKKIMLLCAALLVFAASAEAQNMDTANHTNELFVEYDSDPSFPGGLFEMYKFIDDNMQYPSMAAEKGIEGRVYVQFDVDTDGTILNPRVLRDIGGGCGEEALRIVGLMPKWEPGKHWTPGINGGKVVRCTFILPILFELKKKN